MKIIYIILLTLTVFSLYGEIFTAQDSMLLSDNLKLIELESSDLNFLKDWADETYLKNNIIVKSINNPYYFLDYIEEIDNADTQEKLHEQAFNFLGNNQDLTSSYQDKNKSEFMLTDEIDTFQLAVIIEQYIDKKLYNYSLIFNKLSAEQIDTLYTFASMQFVNTEEEISIDSKKLEDIVKLIEWQRFNDPISIDASTINEENFEIYNIANFLTVNAPNIEWESEANLIETSLGLIIIGGVRNDVYDIDECIAIIEPSGNDVYNFIDYKQSSFLLVDFDGDDYYKSEASMFSALKGFSIGYDLAGDDVYTAVNEVFSSKLGFQSFVDQSGHDIYKSNQFSLGASILGYSTLIDKDGNDTYTNALYGEGFGSVWGFGVLMDLKGSDNYLSGNLEFHAPLAPNDYQSMGQGMGIGLRPDLGGGIGILIDKEGNDRYNGSVYAQGVGYWYALGILIDSSGNDFYNAVYYPQGSGIHLAGGALIDKQGEDSYYSKHGPGQGAGHDFGLGIFIDAEGNDHYSIEGGNGLGLTNSVGVFIDKKGNDRYENGVNSNYGYGKKARSTGSIGIFIDGQGKDYYTKTTMADSTHWTQGLYGIGADLEFYQSQLEVDKSVEMLAIEFSDHDPIDEIFQYASQWEVGNVVEQVRKAREILIARPDESSQYIMNNKINTRDTKEYRAIKEFYENAEDKQTDLISGLSSTDSLIVKNSISLVSDFKLQEATSYIIDFLDGGKYIRENIIALSRYKNDKYIGNIVAFKDNESEKLRFAVARAFVTIDSEKSRQEIEKMQYDSSFLIKTMAREYLKKFHDKETDK